ncbi:hypothetical protein BO94DRAFT_513126 [Aspergillus sclerotioniger CBS 115572]|uniref:Uncharacterized protein n=1 Tax=Aspergillus sclerotioniger CBS 115572 TaxID=1450535 RepID=A0A317X0Y2_9EURO|nr:hypothetical protein BO94DRAFT_513126 [Aspergillus sclerotioniger CBS 115572]PWY91955.1 hypothetical protein BO94DRAFT_513126 [Aspergillus sclerotioniger CBS 115572]
MYHPKESSHFPVPRKAPVPKRTRPLSHKQQQMHLRRLFEKQVQQEQHPHLPTHQRPPPSNQDHPPQAEKSLYCDTTPIIINNPYKPSLISFPPLESITPQTQQRLYNP